MVAAVTGFPGRSRRRPHGGPAASRRYERRRPEKTPLHKIISENLESWLEWREAAERPVPVYVEEEFRGYLECGLLCFGFARALCTGCGQGFVVAFSCKGRGVCPSCNGRHMNQTAAHLADHVIPPVSVRQWVISVPKRLRGFLADRPRAVDAVTRIFLGEIERTLCAAAGVTSDAPASARPRLGGISFLHRFGSALNHHV
ncbi:MAG: transposase zinc-binding domain-containing protein, partial [Planctomycetota bacterium]